MGRTWLSTALVAGIGVLLLVIALTVPRAIYRERIPRDPSAFARASVQPALKPDPSAPRRLIVVFHGYSGRPLTDVHATISEIAPAADVLAPVYSASMYTNERPLEIVRQYLRAIDRATTAAAGRAAPYEQITLVGYSIGALLARKVVVCAHTGCPLDYDRREQVRDWRSKVDRVVLLAGMSRGWATSCEKVVSVEQAAASVDSDCAADRLSWTRRRIIGLGQRFAPTLGVGRLILSVRRGEPFVANLRLEWLGLERSSTPMPQMIQLLGDIDEVVSRSDNIDEFVTPNFVFLQLGPPTDHSNVVEMQGPEGAERKEKFTRAMTWSIERLQSATEFTPDPRVRRDPTVTRVVIILHGIRDDGRWGLDLATRFEKTDHTRAFARSYGYFAALHFLTPQRMNANVRWFVDQYTELRALYPNAQFDFVGHSNGTYMLAQALRQYHAVNFNRVVFAGSVVPTGFPWVAFDRRLNAIRNYRASEDLVVATLPAFFEHVPWFLQVGAAGHAGFTDDFARRTESRYFARGGHGAVFGYEENYDALVNWVLDTGCAAGETPCAAQELPETRRTSEQSGIAILAHRFCVLVWAGGILGLFAVAHLAVGRRGGSPRGSLARRLLRSTAAGLICILLVLAFLLYL